jgi:hypothetical protein
MKKVIKKMVVTAVKVIVAILLGVTTFLLIIFAKWFERLSQYE